MLPNPIKQLLQCAKQLLQGLKQCAKQLGPKESERVLETLAIASIVATFWTCSSVAGIFIAAVAIYCLINKYR